MTDDQLPFDSQDTEKFGAEEEIKKSDIVIDSSATDNGEKHPAARDRQDYQETKIESQWHGKTETADVAFSASDSSFSPGEQDYDEGVGHSSALFESLLSIELKQNSGSNTGLKTVALSWSGGSRQDLQKLFRSFPNRGNIAYLIFQSINSRRQALSLNELKQFTSLQVVEAKNRMLVERENVYLVPFQHAITIQKGLIHLREIRVSWPVVETYTSKFFESVADEARAGGVGIVLENQLAVAESSNSRDPTMLERSRGINALISGGGRVFFQTNNESNVANHEPERSGKKASIRQIAQFLSALEESASQEDKIIAYGHKVKYLSASSLINNDKESLEILAAAILNALHCSNSIENQAQVFVAVYRRMDQLQIKSVAKYFDVVNQSDIEQAQLKIQTAKLLPLELKLDDETDSSSSAGDSELRDSKIEAEATELQIAEEKIKRLEQANARLYKENLQLEAIHFQASSKKNDFSSIESSTGMGMLVLDKNLFLRRFNRQANSLFNISASDIGKSVLQLSCSLDVVLLQEQARRVLNLRQVKFVDVLIEESLWCLRLAPLLDESDVLVGLIISWPDRQTFQYWHQRIHSHNSRLMGVLNKASIGLMVIDHDGKLIRVNDAVARLLGYERDELYGKEHDQLLQREDVKRIDDLFKGILLKEKDSFQAEIKYICRDGSVIIAQVTCSVMEDAVDNNRQILVILEDISQARQLARKLQQAHKMEALGQLTGGIAHDFNNILAVIMGHTELALSQLEGHDGEKEGRVLRYLQAIEKAGNRAKGLISQMLVYSHRGKSMPQWVNLATLVQNMVNIVGVSIPARINLGVEIEADLPLVKIDPIQADHMILNLCLNARDVLTDGGNIIISVKRLEHLADECASCHESVQGEYVELAVTDDGPGIDPSIRDKLFNPFFSTKPVGQGSGMGLAVVHGIVHDHGAHIGLQSAPGQGASFKLWLPIKDMPRQAASAAG